MTGTAPDQAVLTVNAGSSSVKLALFGPCDAETPRLSAQAERIGGADAAATLRPAGGAREDVPLRDGAGESHEGVLSALLPAVERAGGVAISAIGHRVVHGGPDHTAPVRLDDSVIAALERLVPLARTHQPHALAAIRAVGRLWPETPQVACFDTAFHATIPEVARTLALPARVREAGVRRYGFHGLSYEWIAGALPERLGDAAQGRVVACHLGNGASLCGMVGRESRATSMSFTPLDGLVMGERPGQTDPGAVLFMLEEMGMTLAEVRTVLFKESGLKGLSGLSNDMRTLLASDAEEARLAVGVYVHRIIREIGAAAAEIGGLDGLVFTGGVGENAAPVRARVVEGLAWLGLRLDAGANEANAARISAGGPPVLVIPANEEAVIAAAARRLLAQGDRP